MRLKHTVYMDYQATTPVDAAVLAAMEASYRTEFGNPHAAEHALGWSAAAALERAATIVAEFCGASGDSLLWTSGATEANWLAILGVAAKARGRRILISAAEHKSVFAAAEAAVDRFGCELIVLPVDADACVAEARLGAHLDENVALVSIMAVNNEVGGVNAIEALSRVVKESGALFHVDAAQAPCARSIANLADHADLITLSSHKAYGPQGVGALVVAPDLQSELVPLMAGGGQQNGLRPGTTPVALCVGFAEAIRILSAQGEDERLRVGALRDRFVAGLAQRCGGVALVGAGSEGRHPGNACVRIEGVNGADLVSALQPHVAASTQSACNSGSMDPSPVLLAIGLSSAAARECVRFSLGRFTTHDQIDEAIERVRVIVEDRRAHDASRAARG